MTGIIHVVDDDELARWMMVELLADLGADVRTYAEADAFLSAYRPGPAECLLLDLRMPGMDGLQAQQVLKARGIDLPIIFMSAQAVVMDAVTAMREGADDFLEKPIDGAVLGDKVRQALARSRGLQQRRARQAFRQQQLALLTEREAEVCGLVAAGLSSREVAERLGLSARTVENHRARAMEKLGAGSAVELARWMGAGDGAE